MRRSAKSRRRRQKQQQNKMPRTSDRMRASDPVLGPAEGTCLAMGSGVDDGGGDAVPSLDPMSGSGGGGRGGGGDGSGLHGLGGGGGDGSGLHGLGGGGGGGDGEGGGGGDGDINRCCSRRESGSAVAAASPRLRPQAAPGVEQPATVACGTVSRARTPTPWATPMDAIAREHSIIRADTGPPWSFQRPANAQGTTVLALIEGEHRDRICAILRSFLFCPRARLTCPSRTPHSSSTTGPAPPWAPSLCSRVPAADFRLRPSTSITQHTEHTRPATSTSDVRIPDTAISRPRSCLFLHDSFMLSTCVLGSAHPSTSTVLLPLPVTLRCTRRASSTGGGSTAVDR